MDKSRTELDSELEDLADWVPSMLAETNEASQMTAFAARAGRLDEIRAWPSCVLCFQREMDSSQNH